MTAPTYALAVFDSVKDNRIRHEKWTWDELVRRLSIHERRGTKGGGLWSPTLYRPMTTRGVANVLEVTAVVIDVDDGHPPELVRRRLEQRGLAFLIHSTHSSTPAHPKYRVVLPTEVPCPGNEWQSVWPALVDDLVQGHADPATSDASRIFYFPTCLPDGAPFVYVGEGGVYDWRNLNRTVSRGCREKHGAPPMDPPTSEDRAEARRACAGAELRDAFGRSVEPPIQIGPILHGGAVRGRPNEGRHQRFLQTAIALVRADLSTAQVLAVLDELDLRCPCDIAGHGHDPMENVRARKYAFERAKPRNGGYVPPPFELGSALILPGQARARTSENCGRPLTKGHQPDPDHWDVWGRFYSCNRPECPLCHPRTAHREAKASESELAAAVGAPDANTANAPKGARVADVRDWAAKPWRFVVMPPQPWQIRSPEDFQSFRREAERRARRAGVGYAKTAVHDRLGAKGIRRWCSTGLHLELVGFLGAGGWFGVGPRWLDDEGWYIHRVPIEGQVAEVLRAIYITATRAAAPEDLVRIAGPVPPKLNIGTNACGGGGTVAGGGPGEETGITSAEVRFPTRAVTTMGTPPSGEKARPQLPDVGVWCPVCETWTPRIAIRDLEPCLVVPGKPPPRLPGRFPHDAWVARVPEGFGEARGAAEYRSRHPAHAASVSFWEEAHRDEIGGGPYD